METNMLQMKTGKFCFFILKTLNVTAHYMLKFTDESKVSRDPKLGLNLGGTP
jgi:hypothetical protein